MKEDAQKRLFLCLCVSYESKYNNTHLPISCTSNLLSIFSQVKDHICGIITFTEPKNLNPSININKDLRPFWWTALPEHTHIQNRYRHTFSLARRVFGSDGNVGLPVSPPFCSRLKYLNNHYMRWRFVQIFMFSGWLQWSHWSTFCATSAFLVKCLYSNWIFGALIVVLLSFF